MTDTPKAPGAVGLLPCPFCGGDADMEMDHTVEENHAYGCRRCDVWFDTFNTDGAIAAWNTRAADAAIRAAALEEAANAQGWEAFVKDDAPMYLSDWQRGLVAGQNAVRAAIRALIEKGPTE